MIKQASTDSALKMIKEPSSATKIVSFPEVEEQEKEAKEMEDVIVN